tara:strand:+ start:115 stop:291 length:177 start_codon:yes stop_codon:yes gene_type:complete
MFGSLLALLVSLLLVGAAAVTGHAFAPDGWRVYMTEDAPLRGASLAVYGAQCFHLAVE